MESLKNYYPVKWGEYVFEVLVLHLFYNMTSHKDSCAKICPSMKT